MTKKQRALEIIERLKKEYPDAGCTLDYDQAWKLLVSVRLADQCTDARVNIVAEKLYEKFPDVDALAEAPVEEIEAIVKPCGLGHSKARDISACMKILRDKYDGKVPDDFDELLSLPGVGRKSANLVMGDVFGRPDLVEGGCFGPPCHCDRHPLYPPGEPYGTCGRDQGTGKGGEGAVEDHSARRRQRFLPQTGISRQRSVYRQNPSLLRKMLYQ